MNYKSQLKGWAVDRVIELYKAEGKLVGRPLDVLMKDADVLADYCYIPVKDLESHAEDLFELVRNAPEGEDRIDALLATLEKIKNDREHLFMKPKENGAGKEAIQ